MTFETETWVVAVRGPRVPPELAGSVGVVRGPALEEHYRGPGSLGEHPVVVSAEADPVYVVLFPAMPYPQQVYASWLRMAAPAEVPAHAGGLGNRCRTGVWLVATRAGSATEGWTRAA